MNCFILVDVNIKDMDRFTQYASRITEIISKHHGKYMVKGAQPSIIRDGEDVPQYIVIIQFPTMELADSFIEERTKIGLAEIFDQATYGRVLKVEGFIDLSSKVNLS